MSTLGCSRIDVTVGVEIPRESVSRIVPARRQLKAHRRILFFEDDVTLSSFGYT